VSDPGHSSQGRRLHGASPQSSRQRKGTAEKACIKSTGKASRKKEYGSPEGQAEEDEVICMKLDSTPKLIAAIAGILVGLNLPEIFEFIKNLFR
jgi:hypothetical protein